MSNGNRILLLHCFRLARNTVKISNSKPNIVWDVCHSIMDRMKDNIKDTQQLKYTLGSFATGVAIVTVMDDEERRIGLTVNSLASVSLNPPTISWCLAAKSPSTPAFIRSPHFVIHVLKREQEHLAEQFSRHGINKFDNVPSRPGLSRAPIIENTLSCMECRNVSHHKVGDHIIFLGHVETIAANPGKPLLFWRSAYTELA